MSKEQFILIVINMKKFYLASSTLFITLIFVFAGSAYAGWFDKDKIKVSKCYDVKQFNSYREHKKKGRGFAWEADINLKDDMVIISVISDGKVSLYKAMINMETDRFIGTYPDMKYGTTFVFDLKKESVTSRLGNKFSDKDAKLMGGRETILKCKFS